jgi:hypothetical protein
MYQLSVGSNYLRYYILYDEVHVQAKQTFHYLSQQQAMLVYSSYVLVGTIALLQNRVGLPVVQDFFHAKLLPLLEIIWVDERCSVSFRVRWTV